jgi:adenylate cyclase
MPGVAVHSHIFHMIVSEQFLREASKATSSAVLIALGAIMVVFSALAKRLVMLVGPFLVCAAYAVVAGEAFRQGYVLPVAGPFLAMIVPNLAIFGYRYFTEERQKRQLREKLDLYLDPDIVDQLMFDPDFSQGIPHRKKATVMFTDIEGFSKFAEQTPPDETVQVLNVYLTELTDTIKYYKGYLNKYLGDGTMSIFGIKPGETPESAAENAIRAALEIEKKLKAAGRTWPFGRTRIGIASGEIIVGPIGGVKKQGKQEHTAIGDVVNVSSRLQGMNKELKTSILFEEETFKLVRGKFAIQPLGPQVVRGRAEPVTAYTVEQG